MIYNISNLDNFFLIFVSAWIGMRLGSWIPPENNISSNCLLEFIFLIIGVLCFLMTLSISRGIVSINDNINEENPLNYIEVGSKNNIKSIVFLLGTLVFLAAIIIYFNSQKTFITNVDGIMFQCIAYMWVFLHLIEILPGIVNFIKRKTPKKMAV